MEKNYLYTTLIVVFLCCSTAFGQIVITEIFYNQPGQDEDLEYLEITNIGTTDVDITGYCFIEGVEYTFPATIIAASDYLVIVKDLVAFEQNFGQGITYAQWTNGALRNSGEEIQLADSDGDVIDEVIYSDTAPWPEIADGDGPSLRLCDPISDNNDPNNWTASDEPTGVTLNNEIVYGTPGSMAVCPLASNTDFAKQLVVVFPNPTPEKLFISGIEEVVKYEIYSVNGNRVLTGTLKPEKFISVTDLKKGLFFIKLENDTTLKFVKN
ncbi:MAG: lamin tail domain-containing protein [Nonlabens sp.]